MVILEALFVDLCGKLVVFLEFRDVVVVLDHVVEKSVEVGQRTLLKSVNSNFLGSVLDCWEDALLQQLSLLLTEIWFSVIIVVDKVGVPFVVVERPIEQGAVSEVRHVPKVYESLGLIEHLKRYRILWVLDDLEVLALAALPQELLGAELAHDVLASVADVHGPTNEGAVLAVDHVDLHLVFEAQIAVLGVLTSATRCLETQFIHLGQLVDLDEC